MKNTASSYSHKCNYWITFMYVLCGDTHPLPRAIRYLASSIEMMPVSPDGNSHITLPSIVDDKGLP